MISTPKTIQIFLPLGDPQAIRVAEITTRIVRVIEVPRSLLSEFQQMPESNQVGIYFLVGEDEKTAEPKLYIGQSGNIGKRLSEHNEKKDFWSRAIVALSLTNSLTQTHALFLEWHSLKRATEAGRFELENGNGGSKPHTPAPLEADCMEIFETCRTLLATLGYPVFEPVAKPISNTTPQELFYCKRSGCSAVGEYTTEGFVVLSGSLGSPEVGNSYQNESFAKRRAQLITQGKAQFQNGWLMFKEDVLFSSPSGASAVVLGAPSNGWTDWKSADGKTLNEIKRVGT
ncbi:MAG: GIY-YIG nuclease family protein [Betaproteobacteria bacterium]|jgi:predicted GIY-YIG superfamily endonuclease|nr:GIY-YIG nuclease family protein [Betaproteobacteria bacterium]MBK9785290.1 GIY-YIG nuclease family protein [Candidatus Dechloromonas phosphorivorans]